MNYRYPFSLNSWGEGGGKLAEGKRLEIGQNITSFNITSYPSLRLLPASSNSARIGLWAWKEDLNHASKQTRTHTLRRNINYISRARYPTVRLDHNSSAWSQATGSNKKRLYKSNSQSKNPCTVQVNIGLHPQALTISVQFTTSNI